jgi:alkanesulfonate monooxygenase SsuD/methylene tetrahydromethanopterin reductase-like flavin-dependent oxidoreductase (luciferase family)
VAETRDEAEQVARSGARWLVASYIDPKHAQVGLAGAAFLKLDQDPIDRYLDGVVVWGTPEQVADELLRLREEMFLGYLLCAPLSHRSFTLFTEKVLPRLL